MSMIFSVLFIGLSWIIYIYINFSKSELCFPMLLFPRTVLDMVDMSISLPSVSSSGSFFVTETIFYSLLGYVFFRKGQFLCQEICIAGCVVYFRVIFWIFFILQLLCFALFQLYFPALQKLQRLPHLQVSFPWWFPLLDVVIAMDNMPSH